jgi:hypothetical protein
MPPQIVWTQFDADPISGFDHHHSGRLIGRDLRITDSFGVGFVSLGEAIQELKDLLWGDFINGSIAEFLNKLFDDGPVGSHRIFFRMGLVVIDPDFGCFGKFHGQPPSVNGLTIRMVLTVSMEAIFVGYPEHICLYHIKSVILYGKLK